MPERTLHPEGGVDCEIPHQLESGTKMSVNKDTRP